MKLFNNLYTTVINFQNFINDNNIPNDEHVLIQLLLSGADENKIKSIVADIQQSLPHASILGTTTAGVIADGQILDNKTNASISVFEKAITKTVSYKNKTTDAIIADLHSKIHNTTKMAIIFANTLTFNATELLLQLSKHFPQLTVVGGNSGDDFLFKRCIVFTEQLFDEDVVIALIESETLQVKTKYHMNWKKIGSEIEVTKSLGSTVYELNGEPALNIYRKYLGDEVASSPLEFAMEFPLLFSESDIDIARAPVAFEEESGALTYAGDIPQGTKVKFGFANIQHIEHVNQKDLMQTFDYYNEAVYIYSCAARRQILGDFLNKEIKYLSNIAPTSGFVTYGEFFHDQITCKNSFLNITTTYVVLNENTPTSKLSLDYKPMKKDLYEIRLKALTNFITKTGEELDENIHYLNQFKKCVDEATILSTTNQDGYITSINENFMGVSGYSEKELMGVYHNVVKHPDTPKNIFKDMWDTITKGKMWKGLMKNKRKDGSAYYVLAEISPIYNKDGSLKEYLSIRTDITELEEYKMLLENKLDITKTTLKEKIHYTNQYENAVDSSIAVIKTGTNNIITYVNKKTIELSGYSKEELIGMNCNNLRSHKHYKKKDYEKIKNQLGQKQRVNEILININKDGKEYTVSNIFVPIVDLNDNVIEHLLLMHDITEIVELTQEILDTQKEVVFTMGAIGETRSNETGLHVKRVAEYSYLLARLYGLSEKEAELLKQSSPMHDIGKVGIPDSILNKPGKLTFEEFEVMKTHAKLGYEMLKHSQRDILKTSAIVAYEHHEKWNGEGYPRGLKGEDIHIYGRITAVADVFDALGHDRVYKKAWDIHNILELFKEEKGKHFDPQLIDLFMHNLDRFLEIKYTFK